MLKHKIPWQEMRFSILWKPFLETLILSLIYSAMYFWIVAWPIAFPWPALAECLLLSIYGLGLYAIALQIWNRPVKETMKKTGLKVWLACLALALFGGFVLMALSEVQGSAFVSVLGTICALLVLFVFLPMLIAWMLVCAGGGKQDLPALKSLLASKGFYILEMFLAVFLLMVLWDTMLGGPLYLGDGLHLSLRVEQLLFVKEPGAYPMMMHMLGFSSASPALFIMSCVGSLLTAYLICALFAAVSGKPEIKEKRIPKGRAAVSRKAKRKNR